MSKIKPEEIKKLGDFLAANDWIEWNGDPEKWDQPGILCSEGKMHEPDEDDIKQTKLEIAEIIRYVRKM